MIRSFENNSEQMYASAEPMSSVGVINKTAILLLITFLSGCGVWDICAKGFLDKATMLIWIGIIAGAIFCLISIFKPATSHITGPAYAICEGLALGGISYSYGTMYDGIVLNAIGITFASLFGMLFLYKTKLIQATEKFRRVIFISTIGIGIFYFVSIIASLFGHPLTIFNGGMFGIGVSLVICVIAALNFISDFDNIENAAYRNAPKHYEWYFAVSLMVTLVWLYVEVLRLLAQLNSRR